MTSSDGFQKVGAISLVVSEYGAKGSVKGWNVVSANHSLTDVADQAELQVTGGQFGEICFSESENENENENVTEEKNGKTRNGGARCCQDQQLLLSTNQQSSNTNQYGSIATKLTFSTTFWTTILNNNFLYDVPWYERPFQRLCHIVSRAPQKFHLEYHQ